MYDLNQSHHPILVTDGPFEGFTGETIAQNAGDETKISCVLVRANGSTTTSRPVSPPAPGSRRPIIGVRACWVRASRFNPEGLNRLSRAPFGVGDSGKA